MPDGMDEVDVVSGAALMVKRRAFAQVGGFSSAYFMYAEEVDLCHALRHTGWKIVHCADAEITHFGGQATKKCEDGFVDTAMRDSVFYFLLQTRGRIYARLYRLGMLVSAAFRLIALTVIFPFSVTLGRPMKREKFFRSYRKWLRIGKWGLTAYYSEVTPHKLRASQEKITSI